MIDNEANRKMITEAVYRYKIVFTNAAQKCGGKVRYVSQHSILWGGMGQTGFDPMFWLGVCAGLAIEWIKATKNGGDLVGDLVTARNEVFSTNPGDRQFFQKFAGELNNSHMRQNNLQRALVGVCTLNGASKDFAYPFKGLGLDMQVGGLYYISSGSHAMAAACTGKNSVDFYDPNVGEVRGASKQVFAMYLKEAVEASCLAQGLPITNAATKVMTVQGFK